MWNMAWNASEGLSLMQRVRKLGTGLAATVGVTVLAVAAWGAEGPVRIGVLGDLNGITSSIGGPGSVVAAQLAAEEAGGEVIGRPIQILSADHQNSADVAKSIALKWFNNEGVSAIADLNYTAAVVGVVDAGRAAKGITLISGATSADFTGKWCSPYSTMWSDDTWTLSKVLVDTLLKRNQDTWFFVTNDNSFGKPLQELALAELVKNGGKDLGSTLFPLGSTDFSSDLLRAQSSQAKVVAVASAGSDTVNAVKQAAEFGVTRSAVVVPFLTFITDVDAVGLEQAQGLVLLSGFYWDQSDEARAFTTRFQARLHRVPTKEQAGVYASVKHYLAAVRQAGTLDANAVSAAMRALPVDFLGRHGSIRADGRVMFDVSLYQVKTPAESAARWDYYKEITRIPAADAYHPLDGDACMTADR